MIFTPQTNTNEKKRDLPKYIQRITRNSNKPCFASLSDLFQGWQSFIYDDVEIAGIFNVMDLQIREKFGESFTIYWNVLTIPAFVDYAC